jgi:hypothetical protein
MPDHMSVFRIAMQRCLWLMRVDSGGSIAFRRTAEIGARAPFGKLGANGRFRGLLTLASPKSRRP